MPSTNLHSIFFVLSLSLSVICSSFTLPSRGKKKPTSCEKDRDPHSFLWMVKKDPPSYFFGTIHVPYTRVWDYVPENAKQAFDACSNVFFELDLMDPHTVSALSSCQMLPQGENLVDVLPEDLFQRLKRHLEYVKSMMPQWMTADQRGRGMYADYLFNAIAGNWERKRPVWVMLMVNSLTESDIRSRGVPVLDLYLAQEAQRLMKRTGAVERVEEQCLPLNGLNLSQVLFALNHTLHQHEELRDGDVEVSYTTDDLIQHYNCGELNAVIFGQDSTQVPTLSNSTLSVEDAVVAKNIDLYFRQELIYNRNMRMGNRVVQLMQKHPDESLFFAFGAGHFLGNNTVLDFIQAKGFEVEHLSIGSKVYKGKVKKIRGGQQFSNGMWASNMFTQNDAFYDGSNDSRSLKKTARRPNRRRTSALQRPFPNPYDPTPNPTTSQPRRFNDLWVRLDSYKKQASHLSEENAAAADSRAVEHALRSWFGRHGNLCARSSAPNLLVYAATTLHSVLLLLRFRCVDLTGIT